VISLRIPNEPDRPQPSRANCVPEAGFEVSHCAISREDPWDSSPNRDLVDIKPDLCRDSAARLRFTTTYNTAGTAKVRGSRVRQQVLWVGLWVGNLEIHGLPAIASLPRENFIRNALFTSRMGRNGIDRRTSGKRGPTPAQALVLPQGQATSLQPPLSGSRRDRQSMAPPCPTP